MKQSRKKRNVERKDRQKRKKNEKKERKKERKKELLGRKKEKTNTETYITIKNEEKKGEKNLKARKE